jgi:quercetin dioxygenase-like cupin family protein
MPVYTDFGSNGEGGISYTTASASWQHGQHLSIGLLLMEGGTFSSPHFHNDEQFIYVLKGDVRVAIDGEITNVPVGSLVHFPPGTIHEIAVLGDETAEFLLSRGPARKNPNDDVIRPEGEAAKSILQGTE